MKVFLICYVFIFSFQAAASTGDTYHTTLPRLDKTTLTIAANIFFGDEDETAKPIEAKFYLLDQSIVAILQKNGFNPTDEKGNRLSGEDNYYEALAKTLTNDTEENALLNLLFWKAIKKHQIAFVKTNVQGIGKLRAVSQGRYYLFGCAQNEGEFFIWNLTVNLTGKDNRIEIDQHNAATVIPVEAATYFRY